MATENLLKPPHPSIRHEMAAATENAKEVAKSIELNPAFALERVHTWANGADVAHTHSRVIMAMKNALDKAQIDMPYET